MNRRSGSAVLAFAAFVVAAILFATGRLQNGDVAFAVAGALLAGALV